MVRAKNSSNRKRNLNFIDIKEIFRRRGVISVFMGTDIQIGFTSPKTYCTKKVSLVLYVQSSSF